MTKDEALILFRNKRSNEWNAYRKNNPNWRPDFRGQDFSMIDFDPPNKPPFDLSHADLRGTKFSTFSSSFSRFTPLTAAKIDVYTVFPNEFDPIGAGAVFVTEAQQSQKVSTIFISYAWANEDVVLAIDYWVRQKGLETKIDKRDFFAGARIRDEIMRIMKECEIVLVFYSRESKDKPWPQFERELASDLEMAAKQEGRKPPRIIYIVIDDTPLPSVTETNRIAVMTKGKRFELVCEELYHHILQIPKEPSQIDLKKWEDYVF